MIARPPEEKHDTPLPGAVMPLAEEQKLVPKGIRAQNDNWSLRYQKKKSAHYSDDDDHNQTIPV